MTALAIKPNLEERTVKCRETNDALWILLFKFQGKPSLTSMISFEWSFLYGDVWYREVGGIPLASFFIVFFICFQYVKERIHRHNFELSYWAQSKTIVAHTKVCLLSPSFFFYSFFFLLSPGCPFSDGPRSSIELFTRVPDAERDLGADYPVICMYLHVYCITQYFLAPILLWPVK